jgi:hypothetical protein
MRSPVTLTGTDDPRVLDILPNRPDDRVLIAVIDGGTATGKTTWAHAIAGLYERRTGRCGATVSQDWFLRPRADRNHLYELLRQGQITEAEYHEATWELRRFDEIIAEVQAFRARPRATALPLSGLYNRRTGAADRHLDLTLAPGALVIFEGAGVLHPSRGLSYDAAVWVCAQSMEMVIDRKLARVLDAGISTDRTTVAARLVQAEGRHNTWVEMTCRARADWLLECGTTGTWTLSRG